MMKLTGKLNAINIESMINSHQLDGMRMPVIGRPAPPFKGIAVINGAFKEISLNDYKGKYLVLLFYPLDL